MFPQARTTLVHYRCDYVGYADWPIVPVVRGLGLIETSLNNDCPHRGALTARGITEFMLRRVCAGKVNPARYSAPGLHFRRGDGPRCGVRCSKRSDRPTSGTGQNTTKGLHA